MKLLVLADDLTGALDTGIQFVKAGIQTRLLLDPQSDLSPISTDIEVVVVDTESRHVNKVEAFATIHQLTAQAIKLGAEIIYKKTDSALRGNIGAELMGALSGSGQKQLHFIPAFPKMKRSTVQGIQYIDGTPVADSVFGKDPFNPVQHSAIKDIIHEETDTRVISVTQGKPTPTQDGIIVYDATTDEDILSRAENLTKDSKPLIFAGCAGFASALPEVITFKRGITTVPKLSTSFLFACGSVNAITVAQMVEAEHHGFAHIYLTPEETLTPAYYTTEAGRVKVAAVAANLKAGINTIIDTNTPPGATTAIEYAKTLALPLEEMRNRISQAMGDFLEQLIGEEVNAAMLITGGDTLISFMKTVRAEEITPITEPVTGSVLTEVKINDKKYNIISKSGGFGEKTLIADLAKVILK